MTLRHIRQNRLVSLVLVLWGLQVLWLIWHFGPEAGDLARRLARGQVGPAIRQQEALYRWATRLEKIIPERAAYVFLDNYDAGLEIQMRYFLTPRRHILLAPNLPAAFLFYALHQNHADFLLMRRTPGPLGPGVQAAFTSPAFHRLKVAGPGLTFRVEAGRLKWGFYD